MSLLGWNWERCIVPQHLDLNETPYFPKENDMRFKIFKMQLRD